MNMHNKERLLLAKYLCSSIGYKTPDKVYYKGINNKSYNTKKMILGVG
jgi:hypothetical protein